MLKKILKLSSLQSCRQNSIKIQSNLIVWSTRNIQSKLEENKNEIEEKSRNEDGDNHSKSKNKNPFSTQAIETNFSTKKDMGQNETKSKNPFASEPLITSFLTDKGKPEQVMNIADREKRLKILQLEADIAHQEGRRVPKLDFFKDEHWEYLLNLPSQSARRRYYAYLWQIAMKRESRAKKKEEKAVESVVRREELRREREENNHIIYGLGHCSMFLRIYDSKIDSWNNYKLIRAMQFAPKIVLDCSYDNYMNRKEAVNAAKQLTLCFAENRAHDDPFDMHFCNVNWSTMCMKHLQKTIPTILNPEFPLNIHEECFTKIFPKENIVYLTPHCRKDLEFYDPDDVYVIGALVDTVNNEPLSLAKAKKMGLRMARLPLDRYMQWGSGSGKSLTLNQVLNILLDLKSTGDWPTALQHVPRRKVVDLSEEIELEKQALRKRAKQLSISIEDLLNLKSSKPNTCTSFATPKTVRSKKEGLEFDLDTWGSKRKLE